MPHFKEIKVLIRNSQRPGKNSKLFCTLSDSRLLLLAVGASYGKRLFYVPSVS
jgi:hypothetical protein